MNPAPVAFAAIIIVAAAAAAAVAWMALRYRLPPVPLASRRAAGFPPTPVAVPAGPGQGWDPGQPGAAAVAGVIALIVAVAVAAGITVALLLAGEAQIAAAALVQVGVALGLSTAGYAAGRSTHPGPEQLRLPAAAAGGASVGSPERGTLSWERDTLEWHDWPLPPGIYPLGEPYRPDDGQPPGGNA